MGATGKKRCAKCGRTRLLKFFSKRGDTGHQSYCKECDTRYRAELRAKRQALAAERRNG